MDNRLSDGDSLQPGSRALMASEAEVAFLSPIRVEILIVVRVIGPATVDDIATVLARQVGDVKSHVELLARAGTLVETHPKPGTTLYSRPDVSVTLDGQTDQKVTDRHINTLVWNTMRSMQRFMKRGVEAGRFTEPEGSFTVVAEASRLSTEDRRQIREHRHAIQRILARGRERQEGQLHVLAFFECPIELVDAPDED
jgi:hypothetical protein